MKLEPLPPQSCPECESSKVSQIELTYRTRLRVHRFECEFCGHKWEVTQPMPGCNDGACSD